MSAARVLCRIIAALMEETCVESGELENMVIEACSSKDCVEAVSLALRSLEMARIIRNGPGYVCLSSMRGAEEAQRELGCGDLLSDRSSRASARASGAA